MSLLYAEAVNKNSVHVYSMYVETLVVQGIVGLFSILAMLIYPLWQFLKERCLNSLVRCFGIVHIPGFLIISLTENPFIHNNFTTIFLSLLMVLFAWLI